MSKEMHIDRRRMLFASAGLGALAVCRGLPALANNADILRIGEGSVPDYTHFYVADELDLWRRNGLMVTPARFPAGQLALNAMLAGQVDVATSAETPAMFVALNGLPIQVIASVTTYQSYDLTAGPTIRDLDDLRGKRIAYMQGTNVHFYLDALIKSRGLAWRDINAVNMPPANFVPSLVSGAVDGFIWSEPFISEALKQGPQFRRLHAEGIYYTWTCVSALRSTVEQRPDVLARALRSLMAADEIIKTDGAKAQKMVSDTLKLAPEAMAAVWPTVSFGVAMDKPRLVHVFEQQAQWAIENKLTKPGATMPDFTAIITDEIYRKASAV